MSAYPSSQWTDEKIARYSTMDNIDGKQARRTGQSSGLGELFEYGLSHEVQRITLIKD